MYSDFERFTLKLTRAQAERGAHRGDCAVDIELLLTVPAIRQQLDRIPAADIAAELAEYGAWDDVELADHAMNRARILWIACGDILEELQSRRQEVNRAAV